MEAMRRSYLSVNINTELLFEVLHAKMYYEVDHSKPRNENIKLSKTVKAIDKKRCDEIIYLKMPTQEWYTYDGSAPRTNRLKISRTVTPISEKAVLVTDHN